MGAMVKVSIRQEARDREQAFAHLLPSHDYVVYVDDFEVARIVLRWNVWQLDDVAANAPDFKNLKDAKRWARAYYKANR